MEHGLDIGGIHLKRPIVQGGMGIGVSLSNLAAAVTNAGGLGVISSVQIGFKEADFVKNSLAANIRALKYHIAKAKEMTNGAPIGVNIMSAITHYEEMVRAAIEAKADIIISGAGLPLNLPELTMNSKTLIAPIVSSAKAASVLLKRWDKKYKRIPDMIVVEGSKAGGHLGFTLDEIKDNSSGLADIFAKVKEVVGLYEKEYGKKIPIITAGGVSSPEKVKECLDFGADGIQAATCFITTKECDAHDNFKEVIRTATKDDIVIIKSPVGMPARAVNTPFVKRMQGDKDKITSCYRCLKECSPATAVYCISKALIEAVNGNVNEGLFFVGEKNEVTEISTVKEVMDMLCME